MERVYRYRRHIKWMRKAVTILLLIAVAGLVVGAGVVGLISDEGSGKAVIIVFLILAVVLLLEVALLRYYLGRFTKIVVKLNDRGIEYSNYKSEIFIPYEEIEKLSFPSVRYMGGWMLISSKNQKLRLTVVIEHIGHLLSELKKQLDQREMQHVYHEKKMFNFFKTAVYSDASWDRLYRIVKRQLVMILAGFITVIILTAATDNTNLLSFYLIATIALIFIGYLITEAIFGNDLRKQIKSIQYKKFKTEPKFEYNVYARTFFVGLLVFIIMNLTMFIL